MRKLTDMEAVDAEKEWLLYSANNSLDQDAMDIRNRRAAFMAGLQFALVMTDKAKAREGFQLERFKRAFTLAHQLFRLLAQCLVILNNIRKRLIVGPDEKPVDTLGIGRTIEIVATALKSSKTVLEVLDKVEPDANGHPKGQ